MKKNKTIRNWASRQAKKKFPKGLVEVKHGYQDGLIDGINLAGPFAEWAANEGYILGHSDNGAYWYRNSHPDERVTSNQLVTKYVQFLSKSQQ